MSMATPRPSLAKQFPCQSLFRKNPEKIDCEDRHGKTATALA